MKDSAKKYLKRVLIGYHLKKKMDGKTICVR